MSKVQSILASMGIRKPAQAAKVAKAATAVVSRPAVKAETKGAEAMASQGKAMVNMNNKAKYVKPSIEEIKMENPKSLKACSGWGGGEPDVDPTPRRSGGSPWNNPYGN